MHLQGEGRPRDLEMAKRYFDQARMTSDAGHVPCLIAITYVYFQMFLEKYLQ